MGSVPRMKVPLLVSTIALTAILAAGCSSEPEKVTRESASGCAKAVSALNSYVDKIDEQATKELADTTEKTDAELQASINRSEAHWRVEDRLAGRVLAACTSTKMYEVVIGEEGYREPLKGNAPETCSALDSYRETALCSSVPQ